MKKLLTLTAAGAILATPAMAVQKCVYKPTMDNWEVCNNGTDSASDGHGGWWIDCNGMRYRGIATFSTSDVGDIAENLDYSTTNPTMTYCYCKMIYPVLSKWINVGGRYETKTVDDSAYVSVDRNDECATFCVEYGYEGEGYASSLLKFLNNLEEN